MSHSPPQGGDYSPRGTPPPSGPETPHISGELLKQLAGLNMLHLPYRGGAPAAQDLMANNVDIMFDNIPARSVTSAKRHPAVPAMIDSALSKKAFESPAVKEAFVKQAATANWMSPADAAAFRAADEARLTPIIKASGTRVA